MKDKKQNDSSSTDPGGYNRRRRMEAPIIETKYIQINICTETECIWFDVNSRNDNMCSEFVNVLNCKEVILSCTSSILQTMLQPRKSRKIISSEL